MTGERKGGNRSEDRTKEKRIRDSQKRSNSVSSENGARSRSRNPCNKDKRSRLTRQRKNKSSSQSMDCTSGSSPDSRRRFDREFASRNRDYRNGVRIMHQDNTGRGGGGGGGMGFRKRRSTPGPPLNWSGRDQYDKRRQMSTRGHFQAQSRFDNRQERFRNNSFNRFRDRNWVNRNNFRFNDRNRDRFQDRNNDRGRRNRMGLFNDEQAGDTCKNSSENSIWTMESPERKRERLMQFKSEDQPVTSLSPVDNLTINRGGSQSKKKKPDRSRSSSTSSSSSDTSTSSSSTSSSSSSSATSSTSSSSSSDRDKKRRKKKKLSKKAKKAEKKRREKRRKLKKKQKKKVIKSTKEKKSNFEKKSNKDRLMKDVSVEIADKSKSMAPMTKEEWDKRQSVIRRVYNEETGRHRLLKGDGEVLEEIVTKERHKEINRQATRGDGEYFQSRLRTNK